MSLEIAGGADTATALQTAGTVGQSVLVYFTILLVILALCIHMARSKQMHRFYAVMATAWVIIIDQWVKLLVTRTMTLGGEAPLLPGFFRLRLVHNYGAAWSSLSGARWLLIAITGVGLCALVYLVTHIVRHPLGVWSLWLVIGGGIGNLIDRVRLGYVVDMLETEFMSFPVFNVADIFVTCAAAAAAWYYFKYFEAHDAKNWEKKNDGTDPSHSGE